MKSQSNVAPDKIWVKQIENNIATVMLRDNVVKFEKSVGDNEKENIYEYDEVTVEIADRTRLEGYIETHFDELFLIGERFEFEKTLPNDNDILLTVITNLMLEIDTIKAKLQLLEGK